MIPGERASICNGFIALQEKLKAPFCASQVVFTDSSELWWEILAKQGLRDLAPCFCSSYNEEKLDPRKIC